MRIIYGRRGQRDLVYLRKSKMDAMRDLMDDSREWITQETKDQLEIIGNLQQTGNKAIINAVEPMEERIKEIQTKSMPDLIEEMRKFSHSQTGMKMEANHYQLFHVYVEAVARLVLELMHMRDGIDTIVSAHLGTVFPEKKPSSATIM